MRQKYIEEDFPPYFIHGEYPDGSVDIETIDGTVCTRISRPDAERLIHDRYAIIERLTKVALAFDRCSSAEFAACWHGNKP